jgi:hypothetical protein
LPRGKVGRELQRRRRQLRRLSKSSSVEWVRGTVAGARGSRAQRQDRAIVLSGGAAALCGLERSLPSQASPAASLPAARRGKRQQADADLLGCMKGLLAPRFAESSLPADAAAPSRPAATARHRRGCFRAKLAHRFCRPSLRAAGLAFILFIEMPSFLPHLPACSVGRPGPSEAPQPRRAAMPL